MAMMSINRRKNPRSSQPVVLQFRKLDEQRDAVWDMSLARNISRSGAFFNSTYKLNEGEEIEINVYNPHSEKVDKCVCTVVRSIGVKDHYLFYETAVKFKSLYENSLRSINDFVENSLAFA